MLPEILNLINTIYINYYSLSLLIPTIFIFTCFLILATTRKKSIAAVHLSFSYFLLFLFFLSCSISAMLYHPLAAYHRWIIVFTSTLSLTQLILFLFYFPDKRSTGFAKVLGGILYSISLGTSAVFYSLTYDSAKVYHLSGQYWDLNEGLVNKAFMLITIIYLIIFLCTGIWRTAVTNTGKRWSILIITISIIVTITIPALTNILSIDGLLDRNTHQTLLSFFTIIGFFIISIVYINTTKDRTNLIIKILLVCFTVFLMAFQGVSYISLNEIDKGYDKLCKKDLVLALDIERYSDRNEYLLAYSMKKDEFKFKMNRSKSAKKINFRKIKNEFYNTAKYERIRRQSGFDLETYRNKISKVLKGDNPYFKGYKEAIKKYINNIPAGTKKPARRTLNYINRIERFLLYNFNKIKKLPDKDFNKHLKKYLARVRPELNPFKKAILSHCKSSDSKGWRLKQEVLRFLSPMKKPGKKLFRKSRSGMRHYTAFMKVSNSGKTVYESGFNYIDYRKFLHPISSKFLYISGAILILIFIGFQSFFFSSFIRPLKTLLKGIYKIRNGDYNVSLPVHTEDELGYIFRNFNTMVETIKTSKEYLDGNTENLELQAEKQTVERKALTDALWGEMELAKKIQTILLPKKPEISGYDISGYMLPSSETGGDYYDVINVNDLDWIIIGDVSGRGLPGGLILMMVQTSIRTVLAGTSNLKPAALLSRVNQVITENIRKFDEDNYMTITAMACLNNGRFFFSGLHQDIMIYRAASKKVELVETHGMWLGILDDVAEVLDDDVLVLGTGDVILIYTDGITEATLKPTINDVLSDDDMFGARRLKDAFQKLGRNAPGDIINGILNELEDYDYDDDITLLVLRRLV